MTLRMQENSTAAYLNGVRADCGVAPLNVTYQENGITALLVPGRFVSESLGTIIRVRFRSVNLILTGAALVVTFLPFSTAVLLPSVSTSVLLPC